MRYIAVVILLVLRLGFAQEIPDSLRTQGLELLKAAQVEPDKIVDAAKLLALAADAFAAAGKEADAEEMNSCLYWAKKKMTIQQIDAFLGKGNGTAKATIAKLEAVEKQEVKVEDAGKWLAKADGYAEAAKDPFLAAVRYFEVASRFKGSPEGEQALEKSLKFLQQAKVAIPVTNKVVGAAVKGDGKVYVQSNPVGASILVEAEDGLRDTGSKTPSLVQLPKGNAVLVLRKEKYEDQKVSIQIGDAIVKTDVAVLEKPKFDVDIIAEGLAGFFVYVDGKPVMDKTGKQAIAPCTIRLPSGNSMLGLAKEGFQDVVQRVMVKETGMEQVKVRGRAVGGKTVLANPWNGVTYRVYEITAPSTGYRGWRWFFSNGKVLDENGTEATWTIKGNEITLTYSDGCKPVVIVDSSWNSIDGHNGRGVQMNGLLRGTNLTNASPPPKKK